MSRFTSRRRCDRAREWVSLGLDGQLSDLERPALAAHLRRCGECSTFAAEVRGFTAALRTEPPEPLRRPLATPRRAVAFRAARVSAAAAVMVVAVGLGSVFATTIERDRDPARTAAPPAAGLAQLEWQLRDLERAQVESWTPRRNVIGHVT